MKRIVISVFLILLGIAIIVIPNFSSYLNTESFYFDLSKFLSDYPRFTYPLGVLLIVVGVLYCSFVVISSIKNNTAFIIQKADEDDYGNVDLHYSKRTTFGREELVYESIITLKQHNESIIELEKKKISRFYKRIPPKKRIAFLAISSMPTLVYAGFTVANTGRKISYYHWDRDKAKAIRLKCFGGKAELQESESINSDSKDYVICISTSYEIDNNLVSKQFSDFNIKHYKAKSIGYNSIKTQKDVNNIADSVRKIIANLPSKCFVHLLLACSSELCFAIGQRLNSSVLPNIKIYNLNKNENNELCWDWNIELV